MNIVIYGFGFSGSGAVVDWARDSSAFAVLPKIKSFVRAGGIGEILLAPDRQTQADMARALSARLKRKIRQEPLRKRLPGYQRRQALYHRVRSGVGLGRRTGEHKTNVRSEGVEGWVVDRRYLRDFCRRLEHGETFDAVTYWQHWFSTRVRQYCPDAKRVVLDKCLRFDDPRHDGLWERVYDPVRVIVVHRDPVDQFTEIIRQVGWDKVREKGKYAWGTAEDPGQAFLETTLRCLQRLRDYQRGHPQTCLSVPFEGFVQDHASWAACLGYWLGISAGHVPAARYFDPAVSARNIGIGERYPEAGEMVWRHEGLLAEARALREEVEALSLQASPDNQVA